MTSADSNEMAAPKSPKAPEAPRVSLSEGLATIDALEELPLEDQQPCIDAATTAITYHANFDTNFVDRNAYVASLPKYMEETKAHSELVCLVIKH